MDLPKRSAVFWIGLVAASLLVVACVCGLALLAALAVSRASQPGRSAATQVSDLPAGFPTQTPTSRPIRVGTALPQTDESWPREDVPMPAEADLGTLIGSAEDFSVISDQDFKDVLAFYQGELQAQGWEKVDYGTRITEGDAELHYRKDELNLTVILARIPFVGTLVEIRTQPV